MGWAGFGGTALAAWSVSPGVIGRYSTTATQTADRRGRVLLVAWRLDRHTPSDS